VGAIQNQPFQLSFTRRFITKVLGSLARQACIWWENWINCSNKLTADEQGKVTGDAWERLPEPRTRLELEVVFPDGHSSTYSLGPHTPRLRPQDLELLHKIWLEITSNPEYRGLHHYHIVVLALRELERELRSGNRAQVLELLQNELIYEAESGRWGRDGHMPRVSGSRPRRFIFASFERVRVPISL